MIQGAKFFRARCSPSVAGASRHSRGTAPRAVFSLRLLPALVLPMLPATVTVADEPQLVSLFPFTAQRGASVDVRVRGKALDGAYAVSGWLLPMVYRTV